MYESLTLELTDLITSNIDDSKGAQEIVKRVLNLIAETSRQPQAVPEGWMPLDAAAKSLGKSVSAIRQRLKHPKKPMPQGKVWKQYAKGYEISIHLANFRKFM